jgi:hypothetical protein
MLEVFPADDPLSEWLVTLALAMNDLALVHVHLEHDEEEPAESVDWLRLAISHFTEAALFLQDTADLDEIRSFVESLSDEAQANYASCIAVFNRHRRELFGTRNKATFHYPELRPTRIQGDRAIREALTALNDKRGIVRVGRIREARAIFADDVIAWVFAREVGGLAAMPEFQTEVAEGTTAFIRFANLALEEHLIRSRDSGIAIEHVLPVDPYDLSRGWRLHSGE